MTAPTAPPVTSVTATVADLLAAIIANPTHGVYIYIDTTTPSGAGIAASAVDTALLTAYEADARVKTAEEADATVLAALNVYPAGTTHYVILKAGTTIFDDTETAGEAFVAKLSVDTNVYINQIGIHTIGQLWYQIKTGAYANDYVRHEDVQFLRA